LKAITILIAVVALYFQDLQILFLDALHNEATNQTLLVAPIFIYLVYRKRKMIRAVTSLKETDQHTGILQRIGRSSTLIGILLFTASIIFYWYGSYTFMPLEYHILTLPIFTAGLVLVLFNLETLRQLIFPIAFLFFLTPIPEELLFRLSSALSTSTSFVSSAVANVLGANSVVSTGGINPTIIVLRPDNSILGFSLDTACSGVYPLIAFVMFAFFTAYIIRDKPWKKAVIFLVGIPLMYLLNILRIITVLLLGYRYGDELALQTFHLLGGLTLAVLGTLLLLAVTETVFKLKIFSIRQKVQSCKECQSPAKETESYCHNCGRLLRYPKIKLGKIDITKIVAILVTVSFLVAIQVPVFALTQGPAQLIIQTPSGEKGNTQILPQIAAYDLDFIYRDKDFENTSQQDASLVYLYAPQDEASQNIWVSVEVAQQRSSLHRWEVCEVLWPETHGYEPNVKQLDLRDLQIQENPPIIARYFAFQSLGDNETELVLYWYETAAFTTNNTMEEEQVKISIIAYLSSPLEIEKAEDQLLPFASAISNYWQPLQTWTPIALAISKNGSTLSAVPVALVICMILLSFVEAVKYRRAKTNLYAKLPREDQQIVDAVIKIKEKSRSTMQNIMATYQNMTATSLDLQHLRDKLARAEEVGLIRRRIINEHDEPIQTWKSNIIDPKEQTWKNPDHARISE
jgi:exosortase